MPSNMVSSKASSAVRQKKIGDLFVDRLHSELFKPAGFKKKGRLFSRFLATYGEHYNIQGSAWNSSESPWRFYVNCGISFIDVPIRTKGVGMWAFHAHSRLRLLVPQARDEYDISFENLEATLSEVIAQLNLCFAYFAHRHDILKTSYIESNYYHSFPHDPELTRD